MDRLKHIVMGWLENLKQENLKRENLKREYLKHENLLHAAEEWLKNSNWQDSVWLVFPLLISWGLGDYLWRDLVENSDLVGAIVIVFSVLAGFLVMAMTFIAGSILQKTNNQQEFANAKVAIRYSLVKYKFMFVLYMLTIVMALVVHATMPTPRGYTLVTPHLWLCYAASFSFLLSLWLPGSLLKTQMECHEAVFRKKIPAKAKETAESENQ